MRSAESRTYWIDRLRDEFSLRGTGHIGYSRAYNTWLYRSKRRALEHAVRDLEPPQHVLDVGCGTGWGIEQLLRLGFTDVEGCDVVPDAVRRVGERFPEAAVFELDIGEGEIPRPDATYDLITAIDVLYCIVSDNKWEAAVAQLARVLKLGGRLVVTDDFVHPDSEDAQHVRFRSLGRWTSIAERYGLEFQNVYAMHSWLGREKRVGPLRLVPGAARGALEYALDRVVPHEPHLQCALITKRGDSVEVPEAPAAAHG